MQRIRNLLLFYESALLLAAMMIVASLVMWVGVPLAWLWVGSQIQAQTNSLGTAMAAMMAGTIVTIAALVLCLGWLNRKHIELREARGLDTSGSTALEHALVGSAAVAVVGFSIWFFGFSGSSPLPLNISY